MAETLYNKVIYAGKTLIDLTADTVTADNLLKNFTAHSKSGAIITGTCSYDANTSDANAVAAEILLNKIAYVKGAKVTGSMPNRGGVTGSISTKTGSYTIPKGYHDGSGTVSISSTEQQKLLPENIRENVTILGVTGTMSGNEGEYPAPTKTVTPSTAAQTITPGVDGSGKAYTCMREVTVEAIPYSEVVNSVGGITVTIGSAS